MTPKKPEKKSASTLIVEKTKVEQSNADEILSDYGYCKIPSHFFDLKKSNSKGVTLSMTRWQFGRSTEEN